jgi:hypothetical protein
MRPCDPEPGYDLKNAAGTGSRKGVLRHPPSGQVQDVTLPQTIKMVNETNPNPIWGKMI